MTIRRDHEQTQAGSEVVLRQTSETPTHLSVHPETQQTATHGEKTQET